ncbi:hypothetical protein ACUXXQ_004836, partial [Escherichia coli]
DEGFFITAPFINGLFLTATPCCTGGVLTLTGVFVRRGEGSRFLQESLCQRLFCALNRASLLFSGE